MIKTSLNRAYLASLCSAQISLQGTSDTLRTLGEMHLLNLTYIKIHIF